MTPALVVLGALASIGVALWALATVGATLIVTQSWLFQRLRASLSGAVPEAKERPAGYQDTAAHGYWWPETPRALGVLVHCPLCLGFWWGAYFGALLLTTLLVWWAAAFGAVVLGPGGIALLFGAIFAFGCGGIGPLVAGLSRSLPDGGQGAIGLTWQC